ncbi:hypothetical protein [Streptomyces sp. NBC_00841]|uniref:hypothetical protein n=1 Tax=Streptomyces sp. NBC_00841 TaxID=2975847 RepID=UPI003FA35C21
MFPREHRRGRVRPAAAGQLPYPGSGSAQFLEVRHREHATVEDHIRCGKNTGFGRFPSRDFNVNAA